MRVRPLLHFWQKVSNDWVFNLSGLLAYNILMTMFPILLALLAIAGFILATVSPGSQQRWWRLSPTRSQGAAQGRAASWRRWR